MRAVSVVFFTGSDDALLQLVPDYAAHNADQQVYTHVMDDQKREAASIMDTPLSGTLQNIG